jgi:hypothetical protein
MANTFELISSVTVGSGGAASIDFTSIPATFTDLCLKFSTRNTADVNTFNLTINTVGTNQTTRRVMGTGSSAISSTYTEIQTNPSSTTANTFANGELYFPNYAGSTNKSFSLDVVSENNATQAYATMEAWLWSSTAAINALSIVGRGGGTLAQYSTAYLYGVKNA